MSGIIPDESEFMGKAEQKELFGCDNTNALYASGRASTRQARPSTTSRPVSQRLGGGE